MPKMLRRLNGWNSKCLVRTCHFNARDHRSTNVLGFSSSSSSSFSSFSFSFPSAHKSRCAAWNQPSLSVASADRSKSTISPSQRNETTTTATRSSSNSSSSNTSSSPHRIVFLGTPDAAAVVLRELLLESNKSIAEDEASGGAWREKFQVSAVVTRPSKRKTHGKVLEGSPVASVATELGLSEDIIFSPESAKDEDFLREMRQLQPSLCVTAAYGNILPQEFLDIPTYGTVNIHPSELPYFRGPAPVQRAMMRGDRNLCVSLAFTVLKMDAGKIVDQKWLRIEDNETSDVALSKLFTLGSEMLIESLPKLLTGAAHGEAKEQDDGNATHAPKLSKSEGVLQPYGMTARQCHDTNCALNVWPGTSIKFKCLTPVNVKKKGKVAGAGAAETESESELGEENMKEDTFVMKISETSVEESIEEWDSEKMPMEVGRAQMYKGRKSVDMLVVCAEKTLLRVGRIQLPGKKPMQPRAFFNGRKGATLTAEGAPLEVEFNPEILSKIAKADVGRGINLN